MLHKLCVYIASLQLTVQNKSGAKHYGIHTPVWRHISKAAARGHKKGVIVDLITVNIIYVRVGVADSCFQDNKITEYLIKKTGTIIHRELKNMCTKKVNSILQQSSANAMEEFDWSKLINELKTHAPTFLKILEACTRTRHYRNNRLGIIGVCTAILLKFRYHHMSLVQKILSVVLQAGHSGKQVNNYIY